MQNGESLFEKHRDKLWKDLPDLLKDRFIHARNEKEKNDAIHNIKYKYGYWALSVVGREDVNCSGGYVLVESLACGRRAGLFLSTVCIVN